MMQIGVMGMSVHRLGMPVPMRMRLARRVARTMIVLVVLVVTVPVLVLHEVVEVFVFVLFGQVQPKAETHETAGDNQLRR
jgi:hypothetical protein